MHKNSISSVLCSWIRPQKKPTPTPELIVITSGYFNPLHAGHIDYFKLARDLGGMHIVIVNNDKQIALKGGIPCMPEAERLTIIKELRCVDTAIISIDETRIVSETLKYIANNYVAKKYIFVNSGDRPPETLDPNEVAACSKSKIEMIFIPSEKRNASSSIRAKMEPRNNG